MSIFHYIIVWMQNIPKVDELKVSWVDNICQPIHEEGHQKRLPVT